MNSTRQNKGKIIFRKLGISTVIAVYLLILVGGIVRSTGSGMGCPDWPKCFGQWIPPTQLSQLPANYKEVYAEKRKEKNSKLAKYLNALGFKKLSQKVCGDKAMYEEADFNVYKTWIEYVNRLIGVIIGFLIFLTLIFSLYFFKSDKKIFYFSLASFILVAFQGWLGSVLVSTNLLTGIITIHMLLAVLIVFLLMYAVSRSFSGQLSIESIKNKKNIYFILSIAIFLSLIQVITGTQVRESIDLIAKQLGEAQRNLWISKLGLEFYFHRSFSWLILAINITLLFSFFRNIDGQKKILYTCSKALLVLVLSEVILGVVMVYWAIPAFVQPLHLLLAVLILGLQFLMFLLLNYSSIRAENNSKIKEQLLYIQ